MTRLMLAVDGGHVEAARLLLAHGADVNAPAGEASGGLAVSCAKSPAMLALLLDAGGDLADTSDELRRVLRGHGGAPN